MVFAKCFFGLLMIFNFQNLLAQKITEKSNQQWVQYYQQLGLSDKVSLLTDGGFRWQDSFKDRVIYIGRIGVGYQVTDRIRLGAGIASTGAYASIGLDKFEIRPYQEIQTAHFLNNVVLQHRLRIEERYFKNVVEGVIQSGHAFNFRFRYQLGLVIPLIKLSKSDSSKWLSFHVSDEIFVNAGKEIVYNFLDKNRFVIGPLYQINKNVNVGLLYNFQYSQLGAPSAYAHDDVLWLTIRHQLILSRNKD